VTVSGSFREATAQCAPFGTLQQHDGDQEDRDDQVHDKNDVFHGQSGPLQIEARF